MSTIIKEKLFTAPEMLDVAQKNQHISIGMVKESILQENRVPLVPASVAYLTGNGHRVLMEAGAGEKAHFQDQEYSEAGAEIIYSKEGVYNCNVILKVAPPTLTELEFFHPNQILISPLQIPLVDADYINKLRQKESLHLQWNISKMMMVRFP